MPTSCPHQYWPNVRMWENITNSGTAAHEILKNETHQFYFRYSSLDSERKILFRLDACSGNVTLHIRRTRPCWPSPSTGEWTHYSATDGVSNVIEILAQSTNWFISVYANKDSRYSLMVIADSQHYPRISAGDLSATQIEKDVIQLSWVPAESQAGNVTRYLVYSSVWFDSERIMTTVCGIEQNTDHAYSAVTCESGTSCNTSIRSLMDNRRYFLNVVAVNGQRSAYGGIIFRTWWDESVKIDFEAIGSYVAAVLGSLVFLLIVTYAILHKIFICFEF